MYYFQAIKNLVEFKDYILNNLGIPPKIFFANDLGFFINKIDMIKTDEARKNLKYIIKDIKSLKEKYNLESHDYYLMSALNGKGILDAFKKFVSKIHQKKFEELQNQGLKYDIEEDNEIPEVGFYFF